MPTAAAPTPLRPAQLLVSSAHRLIHRLLGILLPRSWSDDALGDLWEEFLEWRRSRGPAVALLRYLRRSLGLLLYAAVEHARHLPHALLELPRYVRNLLRRPALPVVAALALGPVLGVAGAFGAALAGVLLGPLPHADPDRIVVVDHEGGGFAGDRQSLSLHRRYVNEVTSVGQWGLFRYDGANVVFPGGARRVLAVRSSAEALTVVGADAALGRLLRPDDDRASARPTLLLSRAAWLEHWAGDPDVVGRTVEVDGQLRTIVGVLTTSVRLPGPRAELVLSADLDDIPSPTTAFAWSGSIGRLADGARPRAVAEELEVAFASAARDDPRLGAASVGSDGIQPRVTSVRRWQTRHAIPLLAVGFGSSVVLLVLTGAAVLTVLLSSSEQRSRQTRIRAALGATRARLRMDAAVHSVTALAGAFVVGVASAAAGVRGLTATIDVPVDAWTGPGNAAFAALLCALVLVPAMAILRLRPPTHSLRDRHGRRRRADAGHVLLGAQVAGAVVLITALAASARSAWVLAERDLGFEPAGLMTFGVVLPERPYANDPERALALHQSVRGRLAAVPGVEAVAYGLGLPVSHPGWTMPWEVEGQTAHEGPSASHRYRAVSPGYFHVLGISLELGRAFGCDEFSGPPRAVIVNEAFAALYWTLPENAVGKRVRPAGHAYWSEIVGVVGNTADQGAAAAPAAMIYQPLTSRGAPQELRFVQYVTRGPAPANVVATAARSAFAELDPRVPAFAFETGAGMLRRALASERMSLVLLSWTAGLGLLAAALAVGGLVLLATARRSREIGVRKALGGSDAELRWRCIAPLWLPLLIGTLAGLTLVASGLRVPQDLLHEAGSWTEHAGAALLLIVPILLSAGYVGSRRVVRIEPSEALREYPPPLVVLRSRSLTRR